MKFSHLPELYPANVEKITQISPFSPEFNVNLRKDFFQKLKKSRFIPQ